MPYIIFASIGLLIVFFKFKGCNNGPSEVDRIRDSLRIEKALNDTIRIAASILSVKFDSSIHRNTVDSLKFTKKIDSLKKVNASLKSNFLSTRDTIVSLHSRLETAFLFNDSNAVWRIADSLNNELVKANNELFAWQLGRDSSETAQMDEIARLRGVIVELQQEIGQFKTLLKQSTDNSANLARQLDTVLKKMKARKLWARISEGLNVVLAAIIIF